MKDVKKFEDFVVDDIFGNIKEYLSMNNQSDNPYHNNEHMIAVFNNCILLFDIYKNEYKLSTNDKLHLGIAALFHDFNHSGGKLTDSENIEIAINEVESYLKSINMSDILNDVKTLIEATEYPHELHIS